MSNHYEQSEKGKATRKHYRQSEKGKVSQKRYEQSEKCKAAQKRYHQSEKGKAAQKRYRQSEKGKVSQKRCQRSEKRKTARKCYQQSEKGKAAIKCFEIRHPEQIKARSAMKIAVRTGRLPRPDTLQCHYCPARATQYHHWKGYEPEYYLDVIPVCIKCHGKITHKT